jgi:hypothetical protein
MRGLWRLVISWCKYFSIERAKNVKHVVLYICARWPQIENRRKFQIYTEYVKVSLECLPPIRPEKLQITTKSKLLMGIALDRPRSLCY